MNRRNFIEKSSLAIAAFGMPTIVPASVFGKNAPSNKITIGMIGTGRQGFGQNLQGSDMKSIGTRVPGLLDVNDAQVVAVSDVDSWRMNKAKTVIEAHYGKNSANGTYKGCGTHTDFREMLNRKDIDAIMISTPDYWHVPMGIMAAKAGKHVSCEKPLSMSVHQGRELVDALKKYGVVNRTDSEFRSVRPQNHAVELVRNGRIGKLQKVEVSFPSDPTPVAPQADMPVPKDLNYDLWLGPMPYVPYTDMRVHTPFDITKRPNWMRVDNYAQGMIANWGAHYFDMAQWANNTEYSGPVEVEGKGEFPRSLWNSMINFAVTYRYANGVELTCEQTPTSKPSIKYTGSDGWILVADFPGTIKASNPQILTSRPGKGELDLSQTLWDKTDFIEAVKTRRKTLEPIEVGHRTISISQIGLIACQIGEKLKWDPAKELFVGNNAANALLASPLARKEWIL
ncbi:Gfo/Idh/MocA family protein [Dyadobacter psychrotolerans]|uniref:Gfo/Idh/MocA family oxidoreductase n=1 Tax=Dyadobacter psychrotolerans TaxID=2541721 RepID=A0A4R5DC71_9BACT|nr:Gfo/Idh/MocA family oxidoreductase [Dyadobacter psychrotolerans]TDE10547.1 Gfo/Idh/MocA family oxidoreductase [Dyadobacter psychrotolerans]